MVGISRTALAALLALTSSGCAHQQRTDDITAILAVQESIDDALIANDANALAPLLTVDASRTGPGGVLTNRDQWLAQIRSSDIRYLSVARCETEVRVYGDTAIVTGLVDIEVDKPATGREMEHNRYTRTYVLKDGGWRLAAHQATRAPADTSC